MRHYVLFFVFLVLSINMLFGQAPWPDENTTGTSGTLTPYSGDLIVSTNGQIVENLDISNGIKIEANNVLIRNCKFRSLTVAAGNSYTGTVVEDCELLWAGVHDFTLRRCKMVRQYQDLIRISGPNITIEDCFLYITGPREEDAHSDIIQEYPDNTGSNIVVRHNTMWIGMTQNAMLQNVRNAIIENNLIAGGGWCIYGFEGQSIINNHFSTKFYSSVGHFGPVTGTVGCASGNVLHETGLPLASISSLGHCITEDDTVATSTQTDPISISIAPTSINLDNGKTFQLTETVLPVEASDKTVTWTSSETSIATVDSNGLVTAISEGKCTISASTNANQLSSNCQVTVSEMSGPISGTYYCDPVNGKMSNNGSESSPWGSLEDVFDAGKNFAAGDIIYLMNGNHGNPVISIVNPGIVTITRYPGATPEIRRLVFSGADNWAIDNVKITSNGQIVANQNLPLEHPVSPLVENTLVYLNNSENILIKGCDIWSIDDNSVWTTKDDWNYHAWNGIMGKNGCNGITILGCHIKNVNFGFSYGANNLLIKNNIFENFCGDGVQFGSNFTRVEGNTIMNSYQTNGNHNDMIQFYSGSNSKGIEIRGNTIMNYTDPNQPFRATAQGIVLFDQMHTNCIVENNLVSVDHWHGITILGATNCKIINNTVLDPNNAGIGPSWIQMGHSGSGQQSSGNIVRNNICNSLKNDANIAIVENNLTVTWADFDIYFVDYINNDYRLKAGSPAIDAGKSTGAPSVDKNGISRPQGAACDIGCYEFAGTIIDVTGITIIPENLNMKTGEISDLKAVITPLNATNQNVTWVASDPSVIQVDNGNVIALSQGSSIITVTTQDGNFTKKCNVIVSSPSNDYNLALFKPVAVHSEDPSAPHANLVDGDVSDPERWSAEGFPQTAEIDLGEDCNINRVQLYTYLNRTYQYIIEAKPYGGEYSTIIDRRKNKSNSQPIVDDVSTMARYVKITVIGASDYNGTWVSLNELMILGTPNSGGTLTTIYPIADSYDSNINNLDDVNKSQLKIWPNPVSINKPFKIVLQNYQPDESFAIQMFDISGKKVYSKTLVNASGKLVISPYVKSGVYILSVTNNDTSAKSKLIIK